MPETFPPRFFPSARKVFHGLLGCGLASLLLVLATSGAKAESEGGGEEQLRHLLIQECGSCHGLRMTGGLGSPLTPEAISDRSDGYLQTVILRGVPGTAMPPWEARLSEEEVQKLVRMMREGVQ